MISFSKAFISTILLLGGSFFIPGQAGAGDSSVQAPFNTGEIIERVSHHPKVEGDRIVIEDRAYEAEFKEGEAVLKAKQGKPGAEDVVIPVSGRPEVRDGRVVYSSWEGEVEFEGGRRGLRYRERGSTPYGDSLVERYTGNAARIERNFSNPPKQALMESRWIPTGEFLLDTCVVYLPATGSQLHSSIAFDGTNYLVVWDGTQGIFGARVSPLGVVLDSAGIAISPAAWSQVWPSVAFDGTNFLAVWSDRRNNGIADIYGARISQGGTVLDPAGIAISTATYEQIYPAVAFDGTNYLVVWYDERNGFDADIYGARVTPGGVVRDPSGIAICTAANDQNHPSVTFDGTNYLVVWQDGRSLVDYDIYGARVSPGGSVRDPSGFAISNAGGSQESPSIAFDGTNYLVAWQDGRNGSSFDIYGARVTPGRLVLDTTGIAISTAARNQQVPSVAFDGTNYLVVWADSVNGTSDIYGARVTTGGVVVDTSGFAISAVPTSDQRSPCVAFGGSNYLVGWFDGRNPSYCDIYGARVTPGGTVLDTAGIAISTEANHQELPAVAFDGTNYLAVWQEWHSLYSYDIYGTRVTPGGMALDPAGIAISTASKNQTSPSVAYDGADYFIVWQDGRNGTSNIYGARVTPGGIVLDTAGIPIHTTASGQPSLAFDGTNYLVVWSNGDIYGARVTPGGMVLDTAGIAINRSSDSQSLPSIAFDGTNYLVVWNQYHSEPHISWDRIFGSRVSPGGVVLDTTAVDISSNNAFYMSAPSVAFNGANYLVVWEDSRNGSHDVYGARVTPGGGVLDPNGLSISTALNNQLSPALAFDGTNYIVVWQDDRSGSAWDIYGAKVNPSGSVIDSFAVSLQLGDQLGPAIARGNGSQLLIAYSCYTDSINGRPVINQRIWGKFYPMSGVNREEGFGGINPMLELRVYPNPFRERAIINASVSGKLKIYDALGRLVREFPKEAAKPGPLVWDGRDEHGRRLPGGVYFLRFEHGTGCETRKIILIR
jgi:hypothetical protein